MYKENEVFYGTTKTDLENNINHFFDQPGTFFESVHYYKSDDGEEFAADVAYRYTPSDY